MPTRIAFLRAINVGGHTVSMARLRALVGELGWTDVQSFIASGNLRFEAEGAAAAIARQLARHLEGALGYPVPVFVRSPRQLSQVLARLPRAANEPGTTTYVGFLRTAPDSAARRRLATLESAVDSFVPMGKELLWLCRKTISTSTVTGSQLEKALGQQTTVRGLPTVRRMVTAWCTPA